MFWISESWIQVNMHPQLQTAEQLHCHRYKWAGSSWGAWDSCGDSMWQCRGAAVLEHVPETTLSVQRQRQWFLNVDVITCSWQPQLEQSISQNLMSCNLLTVSMSKKILPQNGRYLIYNNFQKQKTGVNRETVREEKGWTGTPKKRWLWTRGPQFRY